jgi:4-hydroxy-tetrahydrodipicolinate synthase
VYVAQAVSDCHRLYVSYIKRCFIICNCIFRMVHSLPLLVPSNPMKPSLSGVFAALCTPIDALGRPDLATFDRIVDFVMERGIHGVVIGGGTAEYPHFSVAERAVLATRASQRVAGRGRVIVCIGTASIFSTLRLAREAADSGCDALLLPMPHFFCYSQDDLISYCEKVCSSVSLPVMLYNLPSFTNPLELSTALRLLKSVPNLVGLKDSSGQEENLEGLATADEQRSYSLFVGDDGLLLSALRAGWDGVVSGIASFAPELIAAVYRSYREGHEDQAMANQASLDELIRRVIAVLPIPWGVRLGLAARGIANGAMHLPPSPARLRQMEEVAIWFGDWAAARGLELDRVWKIAC